MYNRYIPKDTSYTPVSGGGEGGRPRPGAGREGSALFSRLLPGERGLSGLLAGEGAGRLLKAAGLSSVDKGDVLLLLIILFLLAEGDDLDLVIALGLVLLTGLREGGAGGDKRP